MKLRKHRSVLVRRYCANWRIPLVLSVATALVLMQIRVPAQSDSPLTVISPEDGATLSGDATFSVSAAPAVASVEYAIGSKVLGVVEVPPFELTYNSALLLDGSSVLDVRAHDAYGKLIGSASRTVRIDNRGIQVSVDSPDLNRTLSGTVNMSVGSTDPDYFPTFWFANLDGEEAAYGDATVSTPRQTTSKVLSMDTTRVPNGVHELHVNLHSLEGSSGQRRHRDWRGMFTRTVRIDNGRRLMDIRSNYLHVYLVPGDQLNLSCTQLFTDESAAPCTNAAFVSDTPAVASVSNAGLVRGLAEGFAQIKVSGNGKSSNVYVWVRPNHNIPHFSTDGRLLEQYVDGQSVFVTAPFVLEPAELSERVPGLVEEVRRAGVNTLQQGFYPNPRSITRTWESWKSEYDTQYAPRWRYAAAEGFYLLPLGDDVARNIGGDAWWTLNWPYGRQALQYAMQKLGESKVAIAVDVVDEASMIWGPTPLPPGKVGASGSFRSISCTGTNCTVDWPAHPVKADRQPFGTDFRLAGSTNPNLNTTAGRMYTARNITVNSFQFTPASAVSGVFNSGNDPNLEFLWWGGVPGGCPDQCIPSVPNDAIKTISEWIRTAPGAVPISWPALGIHPPSIHANWNGLAAVRNKISDYASHYWDTMKGSKTYPWGWGTAEATSWMRAAFYSRQNLMDQSRPQLMLSSLMGPMYEKHAPGDRFQPPRDVLLNPGSTPQAISATIMTAAAVGNAGVRLYSYDPSWARRNRASAGTGAMLQTGADPFHSNVEHWRAMALANNLLTKVLTPYVLGTALNSPDFGRNIITAARKGPDAVMLMIINGNDGERAVQVDLRPYGEVPNATRYRLSHNRLTVDVIANSQDSIRLGNGETAVYLVPFSAETSFTEPVRLSPPDGTFEAAVLQYNYIYEDQWPSQLPGVDCRQGCMIAVDRRLGDLYYRFSYLDSENRVQERSAVQRMRSSAARAANRSGGRPAGAASRKK